MTVQELKQAITDAEEEHIAYSMLAEIATSKLLDIIKNQTASRRLLQKLRIQLIAAEKEDQ